MTHDDAHANYTDISLLGHVQTLITEMKSSTPSDVSLLFPGLMVYTVTNSPPSHQIWAKILCRWGTQDYNQYQVYNCWSHINENVWRLTDDQIKSTYLVLQATDPKLVKTLSITTEDGISALAFVFKEPLDQYGEEVLEVGMDSTCEHLCHCSVTVELTST